MLIKRKILLLLFCFAANGFMFTRAVAAEKPYQARVVGIAFADPPFPGDFTRSIGGLKDPGGKVTVFIKSNAKNIIAYDRKSTQQSIKTYERNKKGKKTAMAANVVKAPFFARIAKDNRSALLEFEYTFLPRKATTLLVQTGLQLQLTVAGARVPVEQAKLSIKPGSMLKLGPISMKLVKMGKPSWGKAPLEIQFDTDEKLDQLAEIHFYDQQGNEIKSQRSRSMSMSMGGHKKVSVYYMLYKKPDVVRVKAKYWKGLQKIKVPVSITLRPMF